MRESARAPEPLSWVEICVRYPDQFVCLVEIVRVELRNPEIKTACVELLRS